MIGQNYEITNENRDYSTAINNDVSKALKLTDKSKETIESNISASLISKVEKPSVKVYDNVSVNGGNSMDYSIIGPERVPISAKSEGAKAVKTRKINEIRENGGMKVVYNNNSNSTVRNSSYIDAMTQSLNSTPSVTVPSNDNINTYVAVDEAEDKVKVGGNHSILSRINHFSEENKINDVINVNEVNQKDNENLINNGLNSNELVVDAREIEEKANSSLAKEEHKVPEFGGSNSEVFGETPLNDKPIVTHEEDVHEDEHKVTNTNDLVSSIPTYTIKPEKDELSVVHDKLFDIKHDESKDDTLERFANADIDNMSIEDLKQLMAGVKRISEDTVHAEEENNRLESENVAYLEETRNLTSEVSEAKRKFIEEVNRQKESSLRAQREANERHGKLVSEREALESKKTNAKAQLDEINKIRDEFIGSSVNSSSARSR